MNARAEDQDFPAGYALANTAQGRLGLHPRKGTWLAHVRLVAPGDPQALFHRAAAQPARLQPALRQGLLLALMYNPAFAPLKLREVSLSALVFLSFLKNEVL